MGLKNALSSSFATSIHHCCSISLWLDFTAPDVEYENPFDIIILIIDYRSPTRAYAHPASPSPSSPSSAPHGASSAQRGRQRLKQGVPFLLVLW